jgi:hypothetical protein
MVQGKNLAGFGLSFWQGPVDCRSLALSTPAVFFAVSDLSTLL